MSIFLPHLRFLAIPLQVFLDKVLPTEVLSPNEFYRIIVDMMGTDTDHDRYPLVCSRMRCNRVNLSEDNLYQIATIAYYNRSRKRASRLPNFYIISNVKVVDSLSFSRVVILHSIELSKSATLPKSRMQLSDSGGQEVASGKMEDGVWKLEDRVYLKADERYNVEVDKVFTECPPRLQRTKVLHRIINGVKINGFTGNNHMTIRFWIV